MTRLHTTSPIKTVMKYPRPFIAMNILTLLFGIGAIVSGAVALLDILHSKHSNIGHVMIAAIGFTTGICITHIALMGIHEDIINTPKNQDEHSRATTPTTKDEDHTTEPKTHN